MHKKWVVAAALAVALAVPAVGGAHEGHRHKIMGTVSTHRKNQLDVKATDGKTSTITLNEKTRILRGKTKSTADDIRPGERIVVTATETKGTEGNMAMVATEVRLSAAVATR
jgi:hypothetical protein